MTITEQQIKQTAHLARLHFEDDELQSFTDQFQQILNLVEQLEQADTENIQPMANALEVTQRLRADEVTETNQRDKLLTNAPEQDLGLFLVPKVIE